MRSRSLRLLSLLLLLLPALPLSAFSQSQNLGQSPQEPPRSRLPQPEQPPSDDETRIRIEKEMAKKANQQRQEQIKRDTDKLFQLASELKTYVDKTNENILSLDVIKKADQIEKLAHNVKEKMRTE